LLHKVLLTSARAAEEETRAETEVNEPISPATEAAVKEQAVEDAEVKEQE